MNCEFCEKAIESTEPYYEFVVMAAVTHHNGAAETDWDANCFCGSRQIAVCFACRSTSRTDDPIDEYEAHLKERQTLANWKNDE